MTRSVQYGKGQLTVDRSCAARRGSIATEAITTMVDYRSDLTLGDLRAILAAQVAFQLVDRRRFRPSHDIEDDGLMRVVPETMSSN
jgi:hypothetical protein